MAKSLKDNLQELYSQINMNLGLNRVDMKKQYDSNVWVNNYAVGQKVWLKSRYYKTGESKKLAPRKSGPWTVTRILGNGVNFEIRRDSNPKKIIVHHDRIIPMKINTEVSNTKELSIETDSDGNEITRYKTSSLSGTNSES